ncbi:hypothetical protein PsYK624_070860 [Phanerochaete sordida]|uniref:Uncharacterized protein n=1 Tax=Phanerochaete sordida TaxID=48140 RepID=A0A9P3LDU6_9APHY|nr:hypothetical protein PsYK624_070860 [Phanerochaete sordida]
MDVRVHAPRPPTRRLVHPPPRFSSLPRSRNAIHVHYDSSSASSGSQPSLSGSSAETVPPSPPARLAYLTEDISPAVPQNTTPKIVLTIPSVDELVNVPTRPSQPSSAVVGDDGDEVEWVDNYGRWGPDSASDDDDRASITHYILSDYDDASSMYSTPPDSPALRTPTTSPIRHTFYPRSESASSECPSSPTTPTSPTQWLRRALSKPLLRIPKKADTPPPSPVSIPDSLAFKASVKLSGKLSGDSFAPDLVAQDPFAKAPLDSGLHMMSAQCMESGEVLPLGERGGVSCWSASSESLVAHRRVGWSSLKQLFKRTR